jgi:hypothetical protein
MDGIKAMRLDKGVPGVANMKCITLWLFKGRVSFSAHYLPQHPARFELSNNGGRRADELLDVNARIGKMALSFTLWQIGSFWRIVRFLPDNDRMIPEWNRRGR